MRTQLSKLAFMAALGLALAFAFSCSGDDSDGSGGDGNGNSGWNGEPVKKDKISGFSQKGPFIKNSAITLYELDSSFAQTGRSFNSTITDDNGSFEIKNIELVSPYAMLKADGNYRNEVTGNISTAQITLYAIADIREKNNVNVNLLTHLEYHRVLKLVEDGKSLKDAKKQAQGEILAVFGISGEFKDSEDMSIFGTSDGDAALLAISVLLLGDLSEGKFVERLADFSLGLKETGVWNNEEAKNKMGEWAWAVAFGGALGSTSLGNIKNNILGWDLSSAVPDFEKFVNNYSDLGACYAGKEGEFKSHTYTNRDGLKLYYFYTCKDGAWVEERYIDIKCSENRSCLTFTDIRDSQTYANVKIGEQTWMAENLNYNASGSQCGFDLNASCYKYGRLYDWETAKKVCPTGWHLPSNEEWQELVYLAGGQVAGTKLKAIGWGGTDDYGFAALPTGFNASARSFYIDSGQWWSASEYNASKAYLIITSSSSESAELQDPALDDLSTKNSLLSVRCVKD